MLDQTSKKTIFPNSKNISIFVIIFSFLALSIYLVKELNTLKKLTKPYKSYAEKLKKGGFLTGVYLPLELRNIPSAEKIDLVLATKTVKIRNVEAPYNASMIKHGDKYLLFFRYDVPSRKTVLRFFTHIGCVELDKNFEQTEKEFVTIDTNTNSAEDPRVITIGDALYLIYNDLHSTNPFCRSMYLANLDIETLKTNFITELDFQLQPIEKNWIPFEYIDQSGQPSLYFEYNLNPHKILSLADPRANTLQHLVFPNYCAFQQHIWPKSWGNIRGGSTVQKLDGAYLGFFHSSYEDRDQNSFAWYLMGAYTFEAKPPFKMTAISHHPIFFDGIYDSPILNTADPHKRVIFPCSFIVEKQKGREVIHVSCGENDAAVKIITLDKKALLKSLKKI